MLDSELFNNRNSSKSLSRLDSPKKESERKGNSGSEFCVKRLSAQFKINLWADNVLSETPCPFILKQVGHTSLLTSDL